MGAMAQHNTHRPCHAAGKIGRSNLRPELNDRRGLGLRRSAAARREFSGGAVDLKAARHTTVQPVARALWNEVRSADLTAAMEEFNQFSRGHVGRECFPAGFAFELQLHDIVIIRNRFVTAI